MIYFTATMELLAIEVLVSGQSGNSVSEDNCCLELLIACTGYDSWGSK